MSDGDFDDMVGDAPDIADIVHPNYNWNIFRYIADFLHIAGVIVLIATLMSKFVFVRYCKIIYHS